MAPWQSGLIESNDIQMHYTRTGTDGSKPPLVLAHGFSDDGLCWTPVATILSADYDVVMVDARGHGRSAGPEEGYGSDIMAADLAGVITGLGLKRPFILGHSMGAATTLVLAAEYPDLPGAILLEDPPARWAGDTIGGNNPAWLARTRERIIELKRKTREELIATQRANSPTWSDEELGPWADSKLRLSFNVLNRANSATLDWPAIVRRITCPVLLITADPELGGLVNAEQAAAFQALLPQTEVAHIPGAGHSIRREQFDRYMQVVRDFLQRQQR